MRGLPDPMTLTAAAKVKTSIDRDRTMPGRGFGIGGTDSSQIPAATMNPIASRLAGASDESRTPGGLRMSRLARATQRDEDEPLDVREAERGEPGRDRDRDQPDETRLRQSRVGCGRSDGDDREEQCGEDADRRHDRERQPTGRSRSVPTPPPYRQQRYPAPRPDCMAWSARSTNGNGPNVTRHSRKWVADAPVPAGQPSSGWR